MDRHPAESLLIDLGIESPHDIDVEAIAFLLNATVKYRQLDGCEAKIVGTTEKAIISVNSSAIDSRKRFSVAHELGHWHFHRGRQFICRTNDIDNPANNSPGPLNPEWVADRYAANLLMPRYLFLDDLRKSKAISFDVVRNLAAAYQTSLVATAVRMVEMDEYPLILACYEGLRRTWFFASGAVDSRLWPSKILDESTNAYDVALGRSARRDWVKMEADTWFDSFLARGREVKEHATRWGDGRTLVLILLEGWWK